MCGAAVVLGPSHINRVGKSPVDVLEQPKLATHVEKEDAPVGVVGGAEFQGDGNVRLHVDSGEGVDRSFTHGGGEGSSR